MNCKCQTCNCTQIRCGGFGGFAGVLGGVVWVGGWGGRYVVLGLVFFFRFSYINCQEIDTIPKPVEPGLC